MAKKVFEEGLLRGAGTGGVEEHEGVPIRPISEASLGRMIRQRQDLSNQVADTVKEIEKLRQRQDQLEREKSTIESLRRKQEDYERNKQEIMDRLARSMIHLEKEQVRATQAADLLAAVRARFKDALLELRGINEAGWAEDTFEAELDKAIALVEDAHALFRKGVSKVEAGSWHEAGEGSKPGNRVAEFPPELLDGRGFGYWFKVGIAVSLPVMVLMAALFAVWVVLTRVV